MKKLLWIVSVICALASAPEAFAGAAYGVRAGLGIDPDQGVVGIQGQISDKQLKVVRIAPSVDFGFGDDVTTICGNLDLLLVLSPPDSRGGLYVGAGPSLVYWDFKDIEGDTEIGLSLVGGLRLGMGERNAYNAEVRFGISDVPDIRILFGILFGGGAQGGK